MDYDLRFEIYYSRSPIAGFAIRIEIAGACSVVFACSQTKLRWSVRPLAGEKVGRYGNSVHTFTKPQRFSKGVVNSPPALSAAVATAFGGVEGSVEAAGALYDLLSGAVGAVGLLGSQDPDQVPNATLNFLFFDENLNFVNLLGKGFDFDAVTTAAATTTTSFANWETLVLDWVADRKGYIYIYVANPAGRRNVWGQGVV